MSVSKSTEKFRSHKFKPTIILVGGVYGVGKTTIAHELAKRLNIYQRAGVGAIIKTLSSLCDQYKEYKNWGNYTDLSDRQIETELIRESKLMGKIITTIVNRAVACGQNYIIDGVQLLPEYLPLDKARLIVLTVSNQAEYVKRLQEPGLTRVRQSDHVTIANARTIQNIILTHAKKNYIPVFDNVKSVPALCRQVIKQLKLQPIR